MKPEIRKSGIVFQLVDQELKKIQERVQKDSTESKEPNLLKSLKLETTLGNLKSQFDSINVDKLSDGKKNACMHGMQMNHQHQVYVDFRFIILKKSIFDINVLMVACMQARKEEMKW